MSCSREGRQRWRVAGQLTTMEIGAGAAVSARGTIMRKRPSGATAYCCFGPERMVSTPVAPAAVIRLMRNSGRALPLLEGVPVAGDELAAMAVDVRQRAETGKLRLEDEVGMIEGL